MNPIKNQWSIVNCEKYWRVFYTKSNCEKKCEDYIISQDVEVFLPLIKSIRIYRGRKIKKKEPLFKNYIFACVNEKERLSILECPTLIRCLGYKGRPAKVSEKEIESIKIALREPEKIKIEDMPFIKGDEVVVTSGMCKGLVGSIVEIRGSLRVLVYLEEIQKAISVEVNCNEIKKLVADNKAVS